MEILFFIMACAVFGKDNMGNLAFLPFTYIEIITFISSFFFFDMIQKGIMDWFKFNFQIRNDYCNNME